jgi:hypothetical protein
MNRTILFLSFMVLLPLLQAQPVVAPSPDHTGAARGEDWGAYNVTDSFEVGYRFTTVGGDSSLFHNTENYGNGLRLFGTNFTMNSKDGHGLLFDSMSLNATGLGNDPYGAATLRVEKNDVYRYDMHWRKSNYTNLPLDNGAGGNLMNTQRIMQDHDLTLTLAPWAKLQLGYSRVHQTGPQDSTYEAYIGGLARSVLPILQNVRRDYNDYRVGTQLDFLGFRLMLSHQWEYSKDDTTTDSLVPGQPYPLANLMNQPYQPALPVTYSPLVTAYNRTQPMHGLNQVWFANLNRSAKLWALNARMTYSKDDMTSMYYETESGARAVANSTCSNCAAGAPTTAFTYAPGSARRPFTAGDFTFSLFPTTRLTIVNSTSAQNNQYDGTDAALQVNNVAAVKNVLWDYRIGDQRFSDALDANYRVAKWLGMHAEYRYTARWLIDDLIRTGTTNSKDLNTLSNHLNAGTFGIRVKPLKPLSLDVDATLGRDNSALTPIAPAHYHNIRARAEYRQNKRLRFGATYRQVYNLNAPDPVVFTSTYGPPPPSYFASHSRDLSASSSFTLSGKWSLDASYNKRHLDTFANLWSEQPAPNSVTIVSVPGNVSRYISNLHTVSFVARTSIERRGTLYLGYNISRDTGDGRAVQNLGLTDPAASFMASVNTFPMTYQAPMARLSIKMSPKLQWNGGWEFFRYNQKFAYFGYQPYYRAQTGYTSITWTF